MDAGDQAQRLKLELDADPSAIRGTLEHADGTREPFWGWLELMAALERATTSDADASVPVETGLGDHDAQHQ
jgi:hypothetical protein